MNSLTISLYQFTEGLGSLTGVAKARQLLARLVEWTATHAAQGVVLLDFAGIESASASFLRESVLAFRDYARAYQPELFPVVANLDKALREEFQVLLDQRREAMLACRVDSEGGVSEPDVIGTLEPGAKTTLEAIRERGPLSPSELLEGSLPSTLSNRLASLSRQGFVKSWSEGNRRQYQFVLDDGGGRHGD